MYVDALPSRPEGIREAYKKSVRLPSVLSIIQKPQTLSYSSSKSKDPNLKELLKTTTLLFLHKLSFPPDDPTPLKMYLPTAFYLFPLIIASAIMASPAAALRKRLTRSKLDQFTTTVWSVRFSLCYPSTRERNRS